MQFLLISYSCEVTCTYFSAYLGNPEIYSETAWKQKCFMDNLLQKTFMHLLHSTLMETKLHNYV